MPSFFFHTHSSCLRAMERLEQKRLNGKEAQTPQLQKKIHFPSFQEIILTADISPFFQAVLTPVRWLDKRERKQKDSIDSGPGRVSLRTDSLVGTKPARGKKIRFIHIGLLLSLLSSFFRSTIQRAISFLFIWSRLFSSQKKNYKIYLNPIGGWCQDGNTISLVLSLKSSILSTTSFALDKTFWGMVSAAVKQSWCKANMVDQGDGKFGPEAGPRIPPIIMINGFQSKSDVLSWS